MFDLSFICHLSIELKTKIPKVLIVDLSESYGGASARILTLMQNYPAGQIALAVLKGSPVAKYAEEKNLFVIPVGRKKYDVSILFSLVNAIRSFDFEVVDTQNIQSKFWASLSVLLTRTALVSTLNSWYANDCSWPRSRASASARRADARRSDRSAS